MTRTLPSHALRFVAAIIATAHLSTHTAAQFEPIAGQLAEVVGELNSPDFSIRAAAADAISSSASTWGSDQAITDYLRSEQGRSITLEQRRLIVDLMHRRFRKTERGAFGVQMNVNPQTGRPILSRVMPEFPAAQQNLLQQNDELVAVAGVELGRDQVVEGVEVPEQSLLHALVFSRDPGDVVDVVLDRPVQLGTSQRVVRMTVSVPLGSKNNLRAATIRAGSRLDDSLDVAWSVRRARIGLEDLPSRRAELTPFEAPIPDAVVAPERLEPPQRAVREAWLGGHDEGVLVRVITDPNGDVVVETPSRRPIIRRTFKLTDPNGPRDLANALIAGSEGELSATDAHESTRLLSLLAARESTSCELLVAANGDVRFRVGMGATGRELLTRREIERLLRVIEVVPPTEGARNALVTLMEIESEVARLRARIAEAQAEPRLRAALEAELQRLDTKAEALRAVVNTR